MSNRVFAACLLLVLCMSGCGIVKEKNTTAIEEAKKEKKKADPTELAVLDHGNYFQVWKQEDGPLMSFSIFVPESYTGEEEVPLVVSLHFGARKITNFFGNQMMNGLVKPAVEEMGAIVVAPDMINKSWTNFRCEDAVIALIKEVVKKYKIDKSKVMVVGYSAGATGAWYYAARHPDLFTAAIPIAGSPPINYQELEWQIPVLAIHSNSDEIFPFSATRDAVRHVQSTGSKMVQLYELDSISHYESNKYIEHLIEATKWVQRDVWKMRSD